MRTLLFAAAFCMPFLGCKKTESNPNADSCSNTTIALSVKTSVALPCSGTPSSGSIEIAATGSSGFTYSINGGSTFQSSNIFNNLAAGSYNIVVKDVNGCTKTNTSNLVFTPGPQFTAVKALIVNKCRPCHFPNGFAYQDAQFDTDCKIIEKWARIKARSVDNVPTPMPYVPLSSTEKQIIMDWIDGGHGYN